jgi:hypothetical protein
LRLASHTNQLKIASAPVPIALTTITIETEMSEPLNQHAAVPNKAAMPHNNAVVRGSLRKATNAINTISAMNVLSPAIHGCNDESCDIKTVMIPKVTKIG